jgi:hypothetical protein
LFGFSLSIFSCAVQSEAAEYTSFNLRVHDLKPDLRLGCDVAASRETLVIGACGDDEFAGAAYVFSRSNGLWTQMQKLKAPCPLPDDWFGSAVAIDGSNIVCALTGPSDDVYTGSAHVYQQTGNGWQHTAELTATDGEAWDLFGVSLDISGETIAVGTPRGWWTDPPGSVYIFDLEGGTWTQKATLRANDATLNDRFGQSVSLDGDILVVIAGGEMFTDAIGKVYVFERTAGVWRQTKTYQPEDAQSSDGFGSAIALSGTRIVVGAPGKNGGTGAVYVLEKRGASWFRTTTLTPSVTASGFGTTVAVSGNLIVVGTTGEPPEAHVFQRGSRSWNQVAVLRPDVIGVPSWFDSPVAVAGDVIVMGVQGDDDSGINSGSAHVFEWDSDSDGLGDPTEHAIGTDMSNPDSDDDGALDGQEIQAATNPLDSGDIFRIIALGRLESFNWIRWNAKGGNFYRVERSMDLRTWSHAPSNSLDTIFESSRWPSNDAPLLYIDTSPANGMTFYRVLTERNWLQ